MATRWTGDLATWRRRFRGWIATSDQQALYEAAIFFDHRRVAGGFDLDELGAIVREAGTDRVLLARMAAAAWTARPPIGWFNRLRADRGGLVDLKAGGLVPIVDLARVVGVAAGTSVASTSARLEAATRANVLADGDAETLQESFRFLQGLRLDAHAAAAERGDPPDNRVDPARLSVLERRHLKEVLGEVADLQRAILTRLGATASAG